MPFLTNVPLPQCLQHSSARRRLLARDHDRGCTRYLLEVKCLPRRPDVEGLAGHQRAPGIQAALAVVNDSNLVPGPRWHVLLDLGLDEIGACVRRPNLEAPVT